MSLERHNGFFELLGSFLKWLTDAYFGNMLVKSFPTVKRYQAALLESELESKSDSESGLESSDWNSFPDEHSVQSSNAIFPSDEELTFFNDIIQCLGKTSYSCESFLIIQTFSQRYHKRMFLL